MMKEDSTQDLVARAQRGDRKAFEQLVARHQEELQGFVESRLGTALKGRIESEDVVQETLLKAFRSLDEFRWRGERSLPRWLAGIAKNLILHVARDQKLSRRIRLRESARAEMDSPSKNLRREERFDRLEESLHELSAEHREVILLARIEGLPIADVAKKMNRSLKATRQLLWRALKNLRKTFGDTESLRLPGRQLGEQESTNDG